MKKISNIIDNAIENLYIQEIVFDIKQGKIIYN